MLLPPVLERADGVVDFGIELYRRCRQNCAPQLSAVTHWRHYSRTPEKM